MNWQFQRIAASFPQVNSDKKSNKTSLTFTFLACSIESKLKISVEKNFEKFLISYRRWEKEIGGGGVRARRVDRNWPFPQGHANNGGHVGLGSEDVKRNIQVLSNLSHHPQSLLIVGPGSPHKDANLVLLQLDLELLQRSDDSFESGRHVGKVGNSASDDQNLRNSLLESR